MTILNRWTIRARLIMGAAFIIIVFTGFGIFSYGQLGEMGGLVQTLYNHPLKVSNAALQAGQGVIRIESAMKDLMLAESGLERANAIQSIQVLEAAVYKNMAIVENNILGESGKLLAESTRKMLADWKPIRNRMIRDIAGNRTAAIRAYEDEAAHTALLEQRMLDLGDYARTRADGFMSEARKEIAYTLWSTIAIITGVALACLGVAWLMAGSILSCVTRLRETMAQITKTGEMVRAQIGGHNEITDMARYFNDLIGMLENQMWLRNGLNDLNRELIGEKDYDNLARQSINFTARYTNACAGAIYICNGRNTCELKASFAFVERGYLSNRFEAGEGIVGQVAVEKRPILLRNISPAEGMARSATVSEPPRNIYALPLVHEGNLYGVLEIASFEAISDIRREFLDQAGLVIAVALYTASQRDKIQRLLKESRTANDALKARTDEIARANARLTSLNDELREQSRELQIQTDELEAQKGELEAQKGELEAQRLQVEEADRLKSEFLSNMSHELRTPLNSILALSQLMISRGVGKSPEQEGQYLEIIERNGRHLLNLINDILDLSKIEAGRMTFCFTDFKASRLVSRVTGTIRPLAERKGLVLHTSAVPELRFRSDEEKVHQILLNLLSNAVKFTEKGEITLSVRQTGDRIAFSVQDTGIGIKPADLESIFDEFRQVDGSTTRAYEGTGLGLSICRKLSVLLGGSIDVVSQAGKGSTFTLLLPLYPPEEWPPAPPLREIVPLNTEPSVPPDNACYAEPLVLVIDDDVSVRSAIRKCLGDAGYHVAEAGSGQEGLKLAAQLKPFAITLDIVMPDVDGWEVIRELKSRDETADIPVIVISVSDDRSTGMVMGAAGYLLKPVRCDQLTPEIRRLEQDCNLRRIMVVDEDPAVQHQLERLLAERGYRVSTVSEADQALLHLETDRPDLMILGLTWAEAAENAGLSCLAENAECRSVPVVILADNPPDPSVSNPFRDSACRIFVKNALDSQILLSAVAEALESPPEKKKEYPVHEEEPSPDILLVEDNEVAARQICDALEDAGYSVRHASGGHEAIRQIQARKPGAVVLDLMMPEVDGFEVLVTIRAMPETTDIPVLILTAKELTAADRALLHSNHIHQFIQKGAVDRDQLVREVGNMLEKKDGKPCCPAKGCDFVYSGDGKKKILVVEDHPDNRLTLTAMLDEFGYAWMTAEDGRKAVHLAGKFRPDLILMDVQLPVMSGLEAACEIRQNPELANIPIIAVTAKAMSGDRHHITEVGCNDYLPKPVGPAELKAMIRKWI